MSKIPLIRVSDVMQINHAMVDGIATIAEAVAIAVEHNSDCLLVKRRHDDDEYGIVLLADIAKKILGKNRSPERINVYEIMTKPVFSVRPGMDIRYCARLFDQFGLTIAPVIKNNEILGVVSYRDLVLKGMSNA